MPSFSDIRTAADIEAEALAAAKAAQGTDWDGLNAAIMSNPEFNAVYAAVLASHPIIAASLPAALTQVATGQTGMFELLFSQMCAVAEVSPAQREIWAGMAESFNAPPAFVAIVRGLAE